MQYRIDGRTGNKLSVLGLGCMRFSRGVGGIDLPKAEKLIMRAIEAGVNYFDTAYLYMGSESALGAALARNGARGRVYIATKLPIALCGSRADFDKYLAAQLAALDTDYIDYYLIHNINSLEQWNELCGFGIVEWLAARREEGKLRQIGFSFHGARDEFVRLLDARDWDFCQIQYNYANENYQAGAAGLKEASRRGLPVIVMEPLLGGKLAKGLPPSADRAFRKVAPERSPADWALRWLWNQPEVTVVLSGMNEMEQLEENIAAADAAVPGTIVGAEKDAYGEVIGIFREADKIPCTGCAYCMPCPRGVNIPGCFASYNASFVHGRIPGFIMYITSTAANRNGFALASRCARCGQCESHCPQGIKIRESLAAVKKRLEPFYFTLAMRAMRSMAAKKPKK
jgi:predicted aldo/keto reductase-like oxidoreductase